MAKEWWEDFNISEANTILDPGKFEGEARYVPYFWNEYMGGAADRDDGKILGFDINIAEKKKFPELKKRRTVKLYEDDQGFVHEVR